jgi:hypothetical protein
VVVPVVEIATATKRALRENAAVGSGSPDLAAAFFLAGGPGSRLGKNIVDNEEVVEAPH